MNLDDRTCQRKEAEFWIPTPQNADNCDATRIQEPQKFAEMKKGYYSQNALFAE